MILDDIITLATDDTTRISVVLRKCLVLAHVLKNDQLKTWVRHELDGYQETPELPPYRVVASGAKGNFDGPYGTHWNSMPIAPPLLETEHRRFAETIWLTQAIAAYEDALTLPTDGTLTIPWPDLLTLYYQTRIRNNKGMVLRSAWQEIPKSTLVELVDSVRNRTLSLALELKGEIGETDLNHPSPETAETIARTIVQQTFGDIYVASDHASIQVQHTTLTLGDGKQLSKTLKSSGIAQAEIDELSQAIAADNTSVGAPPGNKVIDWIKKQAPNVITGGVKIGASVGQSLLTELLKQHCGFH